MSSEPKGKQPTNKAPAGRSRKEIGAKISANRSSSSLSRSPTMKTNKRSAQVPNPQASGSKTPQTQKKAKVQRRLSVMNLTRLTQDGRKKPDHYRQLALDALSPSMISLQHITEFYEQSYDFYNADDVYPYRGYKKLGKLDEGAFGVVYRGIRIGDRLPVAIKEIDLSKRRTKRIEEMKRELFVLQKMDSPYIVKVIEHFVSADTLCIIMEFCQGSNVTTYLKDVSLNEEEIKNLFRQMLAGLKLMHRKGIAHRDVKLNNFLLDGTKKHVKVADFGLSIVSYKPNLGLQICKSYCGTEPYMSPEILRRNSKGFRQYNPYYADVWALGVCLYAMLTRTFPFKVNLSNSAMYKLAKDRRWKVPKSIRDKVSEELHDLIWHMLDPDCDRRISLNGVLSHPWLNPDMVTLTKEDEQN